MESLDYIQYCLESLNYWSIVVLMTIESSFIPFPSEIVVPPAAYRAAATGEMNIFLIIFFSTVGACIGAIINYALAYYLGRHLIYKFANSSLGHMCLLDINKVQTAEKFFIKNGAVSTMFGRLVPAIRQLISIPAGLSGMNFYKFLFYTSLGAGVWNSILAFIGYYLQSIVPADKLHAAVMEYSMELKYILISLGIFMIAYLIYKGKR